MPQIGSYTEKTVLVSPDEFVIQETAGGTVKKVLFSTISTGVLPGGYEKGTFTPVASGGTTEGTGTYNIQKGNYTKIGNRVFYSLSVGLTAHTGSGDLYISNLPYISLDSSYPKGATGTSGIVFPSGYIVGEVNYANSYIRITNYKDDGTTPAVAIQGVFRGVITGFYTI